MTDEVQSLAVKDADGNERIILLTQEVMTIGRDAGREIRLASAYVSRQHARIERGDSGCLLVDLGSSNGTYHNGTRVEGEITLQPGDVITIADFMITCLGSSDATTRAYIPSPRAARAVPVESEGAPDMLRVDAQLHQVWIGKEVLERQLSAQEFDLLRYLYEHADRVCSSEELSDAIWGAGNWDRNMLHRLVHRLKRKLEPNQEKPRYIQTVPWVGYRVTP